MEGVTPDGLPITRRGHVSIEMSTMEVRQIYGLVGEPGVDQHVVDYQTFATAVTFDARARITGGLFATARFGSGFSSQEKFGAITGLKVGNLMGGVEHVFTVGRGLWLVAGLSLGAPLRQDAGEPPNYAFADGMWSIHESLRKTVPVRFGAGLEMVRGRFSVRVDLEPIVLIPFDRPEPTIPTTNPPPINDPNDTNDVRLLFRHAVEVQYGHSLGVGIRYQGVANSFGGFARNVAEDLYQATVEPFVVVNRDAGFARLGFLKTLDEDTAAHYREAWGLRLSGGFHLD